MVVATSAMSFGADIPTREDMIYKRSIYNAEMRMSRSYWNQTVRFKDRAKGEVKSSVQYDDLTKFELARLQDEKLKALYPNAYARYDKVLKFSSWGFKKKTMPKAEFLKEYEQFLTQ